MGARGFWAIFIRNVVCAAIGTGVLAAAWWLFFRRWPWVWGSVVYGLWVLGLVVAMSVMQWRTRRGMWR
ncbi:hypothetical protein [Actinacidiphila acidipaludis]|uniref:Uncharacterized protein n=1 Tax=Actinacidiphila acidipaludis TaxID=2873382 RepID=A0ABS7PZY8_9ACTN|nr:hypothetical protein [Streptomyces acidipaludis]MBY8876445.1 hypothetical protein [Streptomyces acidipaludis]